MKKVLFVLTMSLYLTPYLAQARTNHIYQCAHTSNDCEGGALGSGMSLEFLEGDRIKASGWTTPKVYQVAQKDKAKSQIVLKNVAHDLADGGSMDLKFDSAMMKGIRQGKAILSLSKQTATCATNFQCELKK